jgi:predicted dienelactone hydrolase
MGLALLALLPAHAAPSSLVGKRVLSIPVTPDVRDPKAATMHAIVWYPAAAGSPLPDVIGVPHNPLFLAGDVVPNADIASTRARYPLIVLSHGTGGSAIQMAWLGTRLASDGYIVAAVSHPGNSTVSGYTAAGFTLWWLRPGDVSLLITQLLRDPPFAPHIDKKRIGAAGFSLGGYTVLELAGARTSLTRFHVFCRRTHWVYCDGPLEFPHSESKTLDEASHNIALSRALQHATASYRDNRIKAIFAIAPACIPALLPQTLKAIAIPAYIVAGSGDPIVSVRDNAFPASSLMPHAELHVFPRDVQHYTFLDQCTDAGAKMLKAYCVSPPALQRAVHEATAAMAAQFFDRVLKI